MKDWFILPMRIVRVLCIITGLIAVALGNPDEGIYFLVLSIVIWTQLRDAEDF